jgi:Abnormal spindle-like microcephaly-assoc'd, ASPM-SPD-2-Hydin
LNVLATIFALSGLLLCGGCALTAGGSSIKSGEGSSSEATGSLAIAAASLSFGKVAVGQTSSQNVTVTNTGSSNVVVSSISVTGNGFSATDVTNVTLDPSQSMTIQVSFKPAAGGAAQGSLSITSNAANPELAVQVSGTGVTPSGVLTASQAGLSFGNVAVGTSATQSVTLTNTGNANVTISGVAVTGTGFAADGGTNASLAPNQSVNVSVNFDPSAPGQTQGQLAVASNASDNSLTVVLSGTGLAQNAQHVVNLTWQQSSSAAIGYFVYRAASGGNLSKLNASASSSTNYADKAVANGTTYQYAVTSLDAANVESAPSNLVTVTIPTN